MPLKERYLVSIVLIYISDCYFTGEIYRTLWRDISNINDLRICAICISWYKIIIMQNLTNQRIALEEKCSQSRCTWKGRQTEYEAERHYWNVGRKTFSCFSISVGALGKTLFDRTAKWLKKEVEVIDRKWRLSLRLKKSTLYQDTDKIKQQ